jgi:transcriptional regulator with XRE-family HTH domain
MSNTNQLDPTTLGSRLRAARQAAGLSQAELERQLKRLDDAQIGNAAMNDMRHVWKHAQLEARNRWAEVDTPNGKVSYAAPAAIFVDEPPCQAFRRLERGRPIHMSWAFGHAQVARAGEPSERPLLRRDYAAAREGRSQLRYDASSIGDEHDFARRHLAQHLAEPGFQLADANRFHSQM